MRILHFNQFGTYVGGVEGYIDDVSRVLASAGHETRLISFVPERPSDLMPGTVQVNAPNLAATLSGIDEAITDFRPDVAYLHVVEEPAIARWVSTRLPTIAYVHSHYLICPGYALFLRRSMRPCLRTAGLGCIVNAQTERCCFGRNPIRHLLRLRQVRSQIAITSRINVLVGSEFMRERLIANGLHPEKVNLLAPLLLQGTVPEYTSPPDPTVILFVGRVTAEKGLRHLIEALASVRSDWHLIVAGDGPDRAACVRLAERLNVIVRVEFEGWAEPARLKMLYQQCAFVVMPSLWPEPYGRVGPEAFFYGRPVVAYNVGGISDWLEDGKTGYLAVPGDVASLNTAITRMLRSPDERVRMGISAQKEANSRWNAETHVQKLEGHFRAAILGFRTDGNESQ